MQGQPFPPTNPSDRPEVTSESVGLFPARLQAIGSAIKSGDLHPSHVRIDKNTEYGYLWWLKGFESGEKVYPAFYMAGAGGNKVAVFPDLAMVAVITSRNFGVRQAHLLTDRLLSEYILASIER